MEEWEVEVMVPSNMAFVHKAMLDVFDEDDRDQFGVNRGYLASRLALGDNFAVNVEEGNVEGVDSYILMCTKVMYTL
jgi:hypothetical protein